MRRAIHKAFILSGSAVLLICVAALRSSAMTAIMLSDRQMVVGSRIILTGTVGGIFSAWDEDHHMIWTYVEIRRDRLLKGKLEETDIVLKELGGTDGITGVKVFGQPEFTRGERVLLYLDTAPDGSLRVAQSFMGAFVISKDHDSGRETVTRSLDGVDVKLIAQPDSEPITNTAELGRYISKIDAILRREAAQVGDAEAARSNVPLLTVPVGYERAKSRSGYAPQFALTDGGIRWMQADTGQPITYHVNPANCPVAGGGQAEISRAMSAWPNQSGANISLQMGSQTAACGLDFDGQNEISFGDCKSQLPPPTGGCAGIVAMTSVEYSSQSEVVSGINFQALLEVHTVFARGMDCILGNSSNFAEVMCHELGHSIGLAHSADPNAIMYFMAHGHGRDATLGTDDKAGVLVVYPSGSSGGGGLTRPTIRRAKVKSSGKLIIIGDDFTATSQIVLNGQTLTQSDVNFDPTTGRLVFRGPLNLGPAGTNVVFVINSVGSSSPFAF